MVYLHGCRGTYGQSIHSPKFYCNSRAHSSQAILRIEEGIRYKYGTSTVMKAFVRIPSVAYRYIPVRYSYSTVVRTEYLYIYQSTCTVRVPAPYKATDRHTTDLSIISINDSHARSGVDVNCRLSAVCGVPTSSDLIESR